MRLTAWQILAQLVRKGLSESSGRVTNGPILFPWQTLVD